MKRDGRSERARAERGAGFTMVELLVVIGVISILLAMVLPGLQRARRAAEDKRAETEVYALHSALRAYLTEYSKWPVSSGSGDYEGEVDARLLKILSGAIATGDPDRQFNPRNRLFLTISSISTNATGYMVDPWDEAYMIALDRNMDNRVNTSSVNLIGQQVAVWSKGRNRVFNGDADSPEFDDLRTW